MLTEGAGTSGAVGVQTHQRPRLRKAGRQSELCQIPTGILEFSRLESGVSHEQESSLLQTDGHIP